MRNSKQLVLALYESWGNRHLDFGKSLRKLADESGLDKTQGSLSDVRVAILSVIRKLRFKERNIKVGSTVMLHGSHELYEVAGFSGHNRAKLKGMRGHYNPESLILVPERMEPLM